jgi:hypothetical protein
MIKCLKRSFSHDAEHIVRRVVTRAHGTLNLTDYSGSIADAVERFVSHQNLPKFEKGFLHNNTSS